MPHIKKNTDKWKLTQSTIKIMRIKIISYEELGMSILYPKIQMILSINDNDDDDIMK